MEKRSFLHPFSPCPQTLFCLNFWRVHMCSLFQRSFFAIFPLFFCTTRHHILLAHIYTTFTHRLQFSAARWAKRRPLAVSFPSPHFFPPLLGPHALHSAHQLPSTPHHHHGLLPPRLTTTPMPTTYKPHNGGTVSSPLWW